MTSSGVVATVLVLSLFLAIVTTTALISQKVYAQSLLTQRLQQDLQREQQDLQRAAEHRAQPQIAFSEDGGVVIR
jgi:hypothetical protein